MVSNIILLGMRLYIPSKNKSIKPKDRSWFNKTCADAASQLKSGGYVNRVEFNARKTQFCLLSHKRTSDPGLNVYMGDMPIAKSETLDVLGTSIRSDLRWDDHVFNVSKEVFRLFGAV